VTLKVVDEAIPDEDLEELHMVGEECIFACFSPHAKPFPSSQSDVSFASECEDINEIVAPMMLAMPELHELCGEASPALSMAHLQLDSLETLAVASTGGALSAA
jgi:hypothetical protein